MLFSSLVFLWYFLPCTALLYYLVRSRPAASNLVLLLASLFFYGWGEPKYVALMVFSILLNYAGGLVVSRWRRKWLLAACVLANLALLGYFKYFNFLAELLNGLLPGEPVAARPIALPIGISFYTFQAISYVADVWRGEIKVQRDPLRLALYISFFPQLIAGPIVQYHDIEDQLARRQVTWEKTAYGIRRFTWGLGKKVLFANTFASVVDRVLSDGCRPYLGTGLVWFAILLYALQIYYDFSGYSDMAIGLAKMFGFDLMENFRYPYMAGSVREFWRRWHISLSTWFRRYVYIPLGGSRKGTARTCLNLFIVFLVTGIWHGAGMNFLLWGAYYGLFVVLERVWLGKCLGRNPRSVLNHLYTLAVVLVGWSLFRVEDMGELGRLWKIMFTGGGGPYRIGMFADARIWTLLVLGVLLCGPLQSLCPALTRRFYREDGTTWADAAAMAVVLALCTVLLVCNTYNPFIYFRF